MYKKLCPTLLIIVIQFFTINILIAGTINYISPKPGSLYNMENTNIIIGFSEKLNFNSIKAEQIKVNGSLSGIHTGKLFFEENTKIIFNPDIPFALGEKVTVSGIKGVEEFSFYIRSVKPVLPDNFYKNISLENEVRNVPFRQDSPNSPDSMPAFTIYNSGSTANGYLFIANFPNNYTGSILMMLNNNGSPNFARVMPFMAYDFKKQNENLLTYYYEIGHMFFGLNSSYNKVDSFFCGGGYSTDLHELVVNPDGSAWLMSYDPQYVDMSGIVPGGKVNALVTGLIIQKINAQKTVVFQWRSWDHFQITDATHENLTASTIDYVHGNAIEVDVDGNIMISSRHMDEITKINSVTGNIIWRLGGKNNQFQFINDTIGFSHQHYIRRISNGNITLFDNGNYHTPQFSRAIEYNIDEDNKTVYLEWEYRHTPNIYAAAMGSVQRLSNGNTLIGWGSASTTLTEVTPEGTIVYELSLPVGQMSYRAFRFEWGPFTNVTQSSDKTASEYILKQNYPNPFNPNTTISYTLSKNNNVILKVYDLLGREVATLVNRFQSAGDYKVQFPDDKFGITKLQSGIYFYKLQAGDFTDVKKMVLIK